MRSYTTPEIQTLLGVDASVLHRWVNSRLIVPDLAANVGSGRARQFSIRSVFEVALAWRLHRLHVRTDEIVRCLDYFRSLDKPDTEHWKRAEFWTRIRGGEVGTAWFIVYASYQADFQVALGPEPPPAPTGDYLRIDVGALSRKLQEAAGELWPVELRRTPDDAALARIWEEAQKAKEDERTRKEQREQEFDAACKAASVAAEAARDDPQTAGFPTIAIDRRVRADLGLPPREYSDEPWNLKGLLTEADAARIRRERATKTTKTKT